MAEILRRHSFRFGLRTMFVVVTLFGVWLGWELKYIHERKTWLRENAALTNPDLIPGNYPEINWLLAPPPNPVQTKLSLPIWRIWLGDAPLPVVNVPGDWTDDERRDLKRLFPEAVCVYDATSEAELLRIHTQIEALDKSQTLVVP